MCYRWIALGFCIVWPLLTGCQGLNTRMRKPISVESIEVVHRTEGDFKGISEAITGRENTGGRFFLRGENEKREGGYFKISFDRAVRQLPLNGTLTIYYFTDATTAQQTQEWRLTIPSGSIYSELYAKVGNDVKPKTHLLAWHAVLKDANGKTLSETKSFAWEMPKSVPRRFSLSK